MSAEPEPQTEAIDPRGHIVRTPGVTGGRARIAGTRIRVSDVWIARNLHGKTPEQIAADVYPWVSLADVYAALTYYYDHEDEMEAEFDEAAAFAEQYLKDNPGTVSVVEG
jgi:uncharacterized protein (DUF433 family)